jgi:DNA-binding NtrC family response regulator
VARVLVVDDDDASREIARLALAGNGDEVRLAADLDTARRLFREESFDLVLSDLWLGAGTGLDLLEEIRQSPSPPPVILVTARGTVETASIAARIGAFDYLAKPFDIADLLSRVRAALAPAEPNEPEHRPDELPESLIVGAHPSMIDLYKTIVRVAPLRIPVLIQGETGTGKELVATALHRFGSSPDGPFVAVNCGAIPGGLLESELFGHARGAFTDARRDHRGAIARADGGTLFLDEIGEVSPAFQVQLLRFLEEGSITPVGSEKAETVRVRVVAATNRDLFELVSRGAFRADFYYRLAGYDLRLPPLRDRRSDIALLVEHFRRRSEEDEGLPSRGPASPRILNLLGECAWPGNVRQLRLAVRRILVDTGALEDVDAAAAILGALGCGRRDGTKGGEGKGDTEPPELVPLEEAERRHILKVIEACGGNRSEAARVLGIERKTLRRKLERFGPFLAADSDEETQP